MIFSSLSVATQATALGRMMQKPLFNSALDSFHDAVMHSPGRQIALSSLFSLLFDSFAFLLSKG
jgi:hypothetical protein